MSKTKANAKPSAPETHPYRITADGWTAGKYRRVGDDDINLTKAEAKYETGIEMASKPGSKASSKPSEQAPAAK